MSVLAELEKQYLTAQLRGDRREALRLILDESAKHHLSPQILARDVIRPAQREIGRLWQENQISIAQEHMATAISQVVLAYLYQQAEPAPSNGKKILVACVEGELHDFPARLVADELDLGGYGVRFLGANVPTDSLLKIMGLEKPDLLALSVTMNFNLGSLRNCVARVRESFPNVKIAIGGHAMSWGKSVGAELGADATGVDADSLIDAARSLLGVGVAR